ncbi:MAG: hypothetical protein ABEJ26_03620 [Halosimplex sp.]
MVPVTLQSGGASPFVVLTLAAVVSVPVALFVGVYLKRALRRNREVDELRERVEELESERE